jgi:hypothetical protein
MAMPAFLSYLPILSDVSTLSCLTTSPLPMPVRRTLSLPGCFSSLPSTPASTSPTSWAMLPSVKTSCYTPSTVRSVSGALLISVPTTPTKKALWPIRGHDAKGHPVCPFGYAFTANGFDFDR